MFASEVYEKLTGYMHQWQTGVLEVWSRHMISFVIWT